MLTCPDPQTIELAQPEDTKRMFWVEPTYKDNCGVYPNCTIDIKTSIQSGSEFNINSSPYIVRYKARDPSGNVNEECTFKITIKRKGIFLLFQRKKKLSPNSGIRVRVRVNWNEE